MTNSRSDNTLPLRDAPRASRSGYIATLDGWRAIAILLVLLQHGQESFLAAHPGLPQRPVLGVCGLFGVRIFFGISGYLITSRILEEIEQRGALSLRGFYIRRAFRILPPLLLLLLVLAVLGITGVVPIQPLEWLSGVLFFANWVSKGWYLGHLWSLAVEEHFYLLWPGLLVAMGTRRGFTIAIVLCPILAVWRLIAWKYHIYTTTAIYWGRTDIQLDGLLWGSLFAYAHRYYRSKYWTMLQKPAVGNAAICLFLVSSQMNHGGYKMGMMLYAAQAFLVPIMLIGTVGNPRSYLSTFLEWKPLKWMGRLSYGMYLWQQMFLSPVHDRSLVLGRLQVWPYNIVCVFLFTVVSYYFLERRLIRVGHRLANPVSAGRQDAAAQSPIAENTAECSPSKP